MSRFGFFFFFQAEDGIRDKLVTGVQTCALPISKELGTRYRHWEEFSLDLAALFRARYQRGQTGAPFADTDKFDTLRKLPFFQNFSDAELWEEIGRAHV